MKLEFPKKMCLDWIIEKGILFLLIFTPLAFGAVQEWSTALMEIVAFIIFGSWLITVLKSSNHEVVKSPLLFFLGVFIGLILFQLVPMSINALHFFSQSTVEIYQEFSTEGNDAWRTISISPSRTKDELYKVLAYIALFIVIINHYRTREQVNSVTLTIICMAGSLAVFAIVQKMMWSGKLYWFYPTEIHSNRDYIWGPYINHNHFAGYLEMAIPLGLGHLVYRTSKLFHHSKNLSIKKNVKNAFSPGLIPLMILTVLVTITSGSLLISLSRGGIIGFVGSVILFLALSNQRRALRKKNGILAAIAIILLFTIVSAHWGKIEGRFREIGEAGKIKRIDVWRDSLRVIKDFPVFGTGLGTFINIYPLYQTKNANMLFEHAENEYIEIISDLGVAGFIVMLAGTAIFFYAVIKAWYKRHSSFVVTITAGGLSSCAAILVHGLMDFNLRIPANALTFAVIAAVTYATVFNVNRKEGPSTKDKRVKSVNHESTAIRTDC